MGGEKKAYWTYGEEGTGKGEIICIVNKEYKKFKKWKKIKLCRLTGKKKKLMLCSSHVQKRKKHFSSLFLAQKALGKPSQTSPFSYSSTSWGLCKPIQHCGKTSPPRNALKTDINLGTMSHTCPWEAEAGGLLRVWDQLSLQVRLSQKKISKTKNKTRKKE